MRAMLASMTERSARSHWMAKASLRAAVTASHERSSAARSMSATATLTPSRASRVRWRSRAHRRRRAPARSCRNPEIHVMILRVLMNRRPGRRRRPDRGGQEVRLDRCPDDGFGGNRPSTSLAYERACRRRSPSWRRRPHTPFQHRGRGRRRDAVLRDLPLARRTGVGTTDRRLTRGFGFHASPPGSQGRNRAVGSGGNPGVCRLRTKEIPTCRGIAYEAGMNTRYLRALCLVSEHGSIAAAARELGLAHTSLAEQIRSWNPIFPPSSLKDEATHRSDERGSGDSGDGQADRIADRRYAHLAQGGRPAGRLRVGSISTALTTLIPAALQMLAKSFPDIDLTVIPGTSASLFRMIREQRDRLRSGVQPPFRLPKSMNWMPIRDEPLALVTQSTAVGADIKTILENSRFIRMDRRSWTGQIVEAFLSSRNIMISELFELDAPENDRHPRLPRIGCHSAA